MAGDRDVGDGARRLSTALGCAVAFVVLYLAAVVWEPGQVVDERLLGRSQVLEFAPLPGAWPVLGRQVLPVLLAVLLLWTVYRARPELLRLAEVGGVLAGTLVVNWLLREVLLPRPFHGQAHGYVDNSFPSTHMALVAVLVLAVWVLAPAHPLILTSGLAAALLVAAVGQVVGHAHRPSDVLGAVLLVGIASGLIRRRM